MNELASITSIKKFPRLSTTLSKLERSEMRLVPLSKSGGVVLSVPTLQLKSPSTKIFYYYYI
jgi:hypothetical protein